MVPGYDSSINVADLSRREFAALAAAAAAAPFVPTTNVSGAPAVTAGEVIERIKKNIGVDWKADSLDTLKAGDITTVAKGIVTTSMATMTVLQQAVKAGANIVLTAQPTFYARADVPTPPAGRGEANQAPAPDPVFTAKNEFITRNRLVVFRLSDHWRQTPSRSAGAGSRGGAPLVEISIGGRFSAVRYSGDLLSMRWWAM